MRERGFTLIEVVVAMAILGVGLIVIIQLFSGGLRLGKTSEEYTKAIGYARMKMEEVAVQDRIEEGMEEGEFDGDFRWQVWAKKMDLLPAGKSADFKPPLDLYQIKVSVLWKDGPKERSTTIESYKAIKPEDETQKS